MTGHLSTADRLLARERLLLSAATGRTRPIAAGRVNILTAAKLTSRHSTHRNGRRLAQPQSYWGWRDLDSLLRSKPPVAMV